MIKPDFCICENKDADQLSGNREADQRLCFRYTDRTIPRYFLNLKFQASSHLVWDLVGNPEDQFSQNEAHISCGYSLEAPWSNEHLQLMFLWRNKKK